MNPKHPDLKKKLDLLYKLRINPRIQSNTDLASSLGITKQAISRWIHGSETRIGNQIPINQLRSLEQIFGIKLHWYAKSYIDFESLLFRKLENEEEVTPIRPERISTSLLPCTSSHVFGRELELRSLDTIWRRNVANVVQIIAFGGVGKSCLINYWLSNLNSENYFGATRVYAWSFYWQGASADVKSSGDFFIEHALEWFGDPDPSQGTPWSKATRLANLIRAEKTLLILDGMEPLQGSPGPKCGYIENPALSLLIKDLATENNGLCIITTRLNVADLESFEEDDRVVSMYLDNLSVSASIELLKSLDIKGSVADFRSAVDKYTCHPLSLTLLGGYLNVVYRGRIGEFRRMKSLFDEQSGSVHAKKIMNAYLDWFSDVPEKSFLFLIGMLDRTISLAELKVIADLEEIEGLTKELQGLTHAQWSYALKSLARARLLSDREVNGDVIIDAHPIVREFIVDKLRSDHSEIWNKGNQLLFEYFQSEISEHPGNLSELNSLFLAVIHGTRARLYNEAFALYFLRIKNRYTMLSMGNHFSDQACIRAFFDDPWSKPSSALPEESQIHLYSSLASNMISLGEINQAIEPTQKSIIWFIKNERWLEATGSAGPYLSMLIAIGKLDDALSMLNSLQGCIENTKNPVVSAVGDSFNAYFQYLSGNTERARELFEDSEKILTLHDPSVEVNFPTISSYYCKFLLDTGDDQAALDRLLTTFAWRKRKTWQVAIDTTSNYASDLLVLGLTFLKRRDFINAKKYLDLQVDLFRTSDELLYLPTGLHSRAKYFIEIGDFDAAEADLNEALQISSRTGAQFGEWETYLNFSNLYRAKQNPELCKRYLQKAKALPDMHSYHFRDKEIEDLESYAA